MHRTKTLGPLARRRADLTRALLDTGVPWGVIGTAANGVPDRYRVRVTALLYEGLTLDQAVERCIGDAEAEVDPS